MSSNNSPAKRRRFAAEAAAKKQVYSSKGADYTEDKNPFSTDFERNRFKRFYERWRNHYHYMEHELDHLAAVYGEFRPDRLKNHD